jgi:hypothetical protein
MAKILMILEMHKYLSFNQYSVGVIFVSYIFGLIINQIYRPWVYENNINDLGIADIGPSFFFVVVVSFTIWLFKIRLTLIKEWDILLITLGYIILEFISYFISFIGTFDFKDFIGLIISYFLTLWLLKWYNPNTLH